MRTVIKIGTRGSALALAQAREVKAFLQKKYRRCSFVLRVIKTEGDQYKTVELFKKNHTGIFTKAIEKALLKKNIDIAVHSAKDLPTEMTKGLCLAAFLKRLNPADALISKKGYTLKTLPKGARVGTGSPRRKRQLHFLRPDLRLIDLRGNLGTRINKVIAKDAPLDAVVLAYAGISRLKKWMKYAKLIKNKAIFPAVGQAALSLQTRSDDKQSYAMARRLNHKETEILIKAERAFLKVLQGGCRVPIGVCSVIRNSKISLTGRVLSATSHKKIEGHAEGNIKEYKKVGQALAKKLLKLGAKEMF